MKDWLFYLVCFLVGGAVGLALGLQPDLPSREYSAVVLLYEHTDGKGWDQTQRFEVDINEAGRGTCDVIWDGRAVEVLLRERRSPKK